MCVTAQNLTKRFGNKVAINDLSIDIPYGGIHAIVGSNGAGKSTLFRMLLGITTPSNGSCELLGNPSNALPAKVRGEVAYVNEEHTLPNWMKVNDVKALQQSFYPHWNHSIYDQVIAYFDVDPKQKVSALSRGERAGFNLSMCLAQRPRLLILDEPTLGLDVVARRSFLEALMFSEISDNLTTIYCSHQMDEVERIAENLIIMEKGQLRSNSSPEEFCARMHYWVAEWDNINHHLYDIPGLLSHSEIDGRQHIVVLDQCPHFSRYIEQHGGRDIEQLPLNLESAVNAFLTANHKKPVKNPIENQSHAL